MTLPHGTGVRMTIKGAQETDHGALVLGDSGPIGTVHPPRLRPRLLRQGHPGFGPKELRLDVRLLGVGLLDIVTLEKAISLTDLAGLHGHRGGPLVLENRSIKILGFDIIKMYADRVFI